MDRGESRMNTRRGKEGNKSRVQEYGFCRQLESLVSIPGEITPVELKYRLPEGRFARTTREYVSNPNQLV